MQNPNEDLKAFVTFGFVTLISLVFFLMDVLNLFSWVEYIQNRIYQPFAYSFYKVNDQIGNYIQSIKDVSHLKDETIQQKVKILELEQELTECRDQFKKVEFIQDQYKSMPEYNFIVADVIDSYYNQKYGYILVNKGKNNGVKLGNLVVVKKSLVGQVVKIYPYLSVVSTIYSPDFKQLVYINDTKITGLLETKDQKLVINDILVTEKIKAGLDVYVLKEDLPLKIRIGKIEDISSNLSEAKREVKVKPDVALNELDKVSILVGT